MATKCRARAFFRQVLSHDDHNETALLWLAWLTEDAYEAVDLLEKVVAYNPANKDARVYLEQARDRKKELDALVAGSNTRSVWGLLQPNKRSSEPVVPLLGEYLLRQGYITRNELNSALKRHSELAQRGRHK